MDNARISVVIPVYNVGCYLVESLQSVLSQTYRHLEIILVDDGSSDNSGEICDIYAKKDNRIRVFHTENRGLSAARNVGIRNATGEFISFVDADDWIEMDMFENLLLKIEETDADVAVCSFIWEGTSPIFEDVIKEGTYIGNEKLEALLEGKINSNVWNKVYRRELFENVYFPEGKNYEDVMIMHRILFMAKKVVVISDPKYHYRIRAESITKTYSASNLLDYAESHFERCQFYNENAQDLYFERKDEMLCYAANGISKVWRWWYGCTSDERRKHSKKIKEMQRFSKNNIPLFGKKGWPKYLRISSFFMRSRSRLSFFVLYNINQFYRKRHPNKASL